MAHLPAPTIRFMCPACLPACCSRRCLHGRSVSAPLAPGRNLVKENAIATGPEAPVSTVLITGASSGIGEALARGHGRILNVASIAAFQPVPSLATYAATKAYVLSLTESLAKELRASGVTVTAVCPGITATQMLNSAVEASARLERLPDFLIADVAEMAAEGFAACMNGEVIRVPGLLNQAATLAGRAVPKWLRRRIAGTLGRSSIAE